MVSFFSNKRPGFCYITEGLWYHSMASFNVKHGAEDFRLITLCSYTWFEDIWALFFQIALMTKCPEKRFNWTPTWHLHKSKASFDVKYGVDLELLCVSLDMMWGVCSLFHMKITVSVTKSSYQDWATMLFNTYLFFFSYTYTLLFCWKIKCCCDRYFPEQIRPQTTVQWYILQNYLSVKIGFNMINKCHTLPIAYTMLVKILQVSIIAVLLRVKQSM